ncbi:unnamed protein product [Prorocentrum cordatum]|uniref:Reverse transcriptase domain-containing protein n=1 Tax=Prorocentrum cordatum TaxID=2364126 RepID=A0ABN9W8N5_9DINO|nr:unnamed protein product [Polarella glacialis]
MPCLEAWARWCYGGPPDLLFGSHVLTSNRGVQQGDALGPLLFSLAVHPLLQELKSDAGLDIVRGYLDDFCVAGEFDATLRALRLIQGRAASLGLEPGDKCEVIPTAGRNTECNLSEFPAVVQREIDACFQFIAQKVESVHKLTATLDEVPLLDDAQARRSTFQICTGTALNESQWQQAPLPLSMGGLGFRFGNSHAAAAYLASCMATRHYCGQIDAAFSWDGGCDGGALAAAANLYNDGSRQEHHIANEDSAADGSFPGRRVLSMKVDEHLLDQLIAASPDVHKRMSHFEFVAALRLWLCCRASSGGDGCPKCDHVMDAQGLHSLCCIAGGDAVHSFAHAAGFWAEKEGIGLLPDDPRRRPGDIHFPTWPFGPPLALDFAVASPRRQSAVQGAAARQFSAATSCEGAKLADGDNGVRCEQLGIRLVPVVVESFVGRGEMAQNVFRALIHARAARSGATVSNVTTSFYSGLSITLTRANARALLARIPQEAGVHADRVSRAATLLQAGRPEAGAQID